MGKRIKKLPKTEAKAKGERIYAWESSPGVYRFHALPAGEVRGPVGAGFLNLLVKGGDTVCVRLHLPGHPIADIVPFGSHTRWVLRPRADGATS